MRRGIILIGAAVWIATPADAADYGFRVVQRPGQFSVFDHGLQSVDSVGSANAVRLSQSGERDKQKVLFRVYVHNGTNHSFTVGAENIVVRRQSDGQVLSTMTYKSATEVEQKQRSKEGFWAGVRSIGRSLATVNAGTMYGSGTYMGTNGWGSFSYTATDPYAQGAAERNAYVMNQQDRANIEDVRALRTAALGELIQTTTVNPGTTFGGITGFWIPKEFGKGRAAVPVTVEVTIDGERHVFSGQVE